MRGKWMLFELFQAFALCETWIVVVFDGANVMVTVERSSRSVLQPAFGAALFVCSRQPSIPSFDGKPAKCAGCMNDCMWVSYTDMMGGYFVQDKTNCHMTWHGLAHHLEYVSATLTQEYDCCDVLPNLCAIARLGTWIDYFWWCSGYWPPCDWWQVQTLTCHP